MASATARKPRTITNEKIDQTKPAWLVIQVCFNGLANFVRLTGYPSTTAYRWFVAGYIPATRRSGEPVHPHIMAVAAENKIKLPADYFVERAANDTDGR